MKIITNLSPLIQVLEMHKYIIFRLCLPCYQKVYLIRFNNVIEKCSDFFHKYEFTAVRYFSLRSRLIRLVIQLLHINSDHCVIQ